MSYSLQTLAAPAAANNAKQDATPERIHGLASTLTTRLDTALKEIQAINLQTKLLSFNAQIEAARAGIVGASFNVVASEMIRLSSTTTAVSDRLRDEMLGPIRSLQDISAALAESVMRVRGTRLSELAAMNVDLIDRNLYERSCDVRWWATDISIVQAATSCRHEDCAATSERMRVILGAYTVYADIVLCDLEGRVIANGHPEKHHFTRNMANSEWFKSALRTGSGEEFGFQGAHRMEEVPGTHVLVYSCTVREGGDQHAAPIGVLGVIFRWDALGQTVVNNTPIAADEKALTRCVVLDANGLVLADTLGRITQETLSFHELAGFMKNGSKAFAMVTLSGKRYLAAYAHSQGFETYSTGWHSLILQHIG
jgi:hypothetical protein